jgi:hypothetical protein
MGLDTKCSDWQVCGVVSVAGGDVVGAGLFVFDFHSTTAGLTARTVFKGVGIGAGGNAGGTALGGDVGPLTSFSSIDVDKPFCIWDLNGAWGRVGSFGSGIGVSYGICAITAAPAWSWKTSYFASQNVGGLGTGLGAGGVEIVGSWRFKKVVGNKPAVDSSTSVA